MRTIKRRRKEGKTDYKARLNLLKSALPRIIIRKTNKYVIAQYIKSEEAQDSIIAGANSKELLKYGWEKENAGSLKSLSACYLTGLLLGKKIKSTGENKAILDLGLARSIKKSRIYAVLKGLTDAGIEIKHKKEIFPDDKRIRGEHLKNKIDFEKIKNKILE
jgi:large subunit ribosomal protein L18